MNTEPMIRAALQAEYDASTRTEALVKQLCPVGSIIAFELPQDNVIYGEVILNGGDRLKIRRNNKEYWIHNFRIIRIVEKYIGPQNGAQDKS